MRPTGAAQPAALQAMPGSTNGAQRGRGHGRRARARGAGAGAGRGRRGACAPRRELVAGRGAGGDGHGRARLQVRALALEPAHLVRGRARVHVARGLVLPGRRRCQRPQLAPAGAALHRGSACPRARCLEACTAPKTCRLYAVRTAAQRPLCKLQPRSLRQAGGGGPGGARARPRSRPGTSSPRARSRAAAAARRRSGASPAPGAGTPARARGSLAVWNGRSSKRCADARWHNWAGAQARDVTHCVRSPARACREACAANGGAP